MRQSGGSVRIALAAILLLAFPARAAEPILLAPAEPQPEAGSLRPGLAVAYAYREVKWLDEAEVWADDTKPGTPLAGFVYANSATGDTVLTSDARELVVAFIEGYLRLEAGTHELEFYSNDGLRVALGGVQVYEHDGRHTCKNDGVVLVSVPKTAWYPVKALFFQRKLTACLNLRVRSSGGVWRFTVPGSYAHAAN